MGIDLCALHIVISASLPIQRPKLSIVEETNAGVWGAGCLEDLATSHTADSTSFPHAVRTLPDLDTQLTTAKGILSRAEYKRCSKPAIVYDHKTACLRIITTSASSTALTVTRTTRSRVLAVQSRSVESTVEIEEGLERQPARCLARVSVGMRQAGSQD